jgi:galactose mutarotase-like enzyme
MRVELKHIRIGDLPAVALANDALSVVVIPEIGGKITSLMSRRTGREWLWKNPHLPLRRPPLDASNFGQFDCGGWDEMFPTVNSCRLPNTGWGDRMLTDHGELWYRPWQTLTAEVVAGEIASLELAVCDPTLPFRFARTASLAAGCGPLVLNYDLSNIGDRPLPYLWAAHPLLAICPGDSIRIPVDTLTSSTGSIGLELGPGSTPFAWPQMRLRSGKTIDFSQVPQRTAGIAAKLFAEHVSTGCVEVRDETRRESIRISFEPTSIPHVGLWLNYGGWSGASPTSYFNAGIEPTTSACDELSVAIRDEKAKQLDLGERHLWQITVKGADDLN